jgi:hypothetical protein
VLKHALDFPHWLMIGGALLVLVGLVGTALQKKAAGAPPSSEQPKVGDGQPVSQPKPMSQPKLDK